MARRDPDKGGRASVGSSDPSTLPKLGALEARVMEALWGRGGWSTPGEVVEMLNPERDVAYTTVMTILVRLWRKGLLERRKDGRAYAYHPVQSREEWTAHRMSEVLAIADNRAEALSRFVDSMEPSDVNQLRRLLRITR
ncbi:MAG: BlaI/MecI/CopY family transcriptional regulator [Acidimicrobiia bacterium]|nr:BlaI/MecI/CopY family transcriptional regulator [Acidimicrobiia bacterium]